MEKKEQLYKKFMRKNQTKNSVKNGACFGFAHLFLLLGVFTLTAVIWWLWKNGRINTGQPLPFSEQISEIRQKKTKQYETIEFQNNTYYVVDQLIIDNTQTLLVASNKKSRTCVYLTGENCWVFVKRGDHTRQLAEIPGYVQLERSSNGEVMLFTYFSDGPYQSSSLSVFNAQEETIAEKVKQSLSAADYSGPFTNEIKKECGNVGPFDFAITKLIKADRTYHLVECINNSFLAGDEDEIFITDTLEPAQIGVDSDNHYQKIFDMLKRNYNDPGEHTFYVNTYFVIIPADFNTFEVLESL